MDLPPALLRFLEKLGFNTVRLRWRLKQLEEDWNERSGPFAFLNRSPGLRHKFCPKCDRMVGAKDEICPSCGARLRSMFMERLARQAGFLFPRGTPVVTACFLAVSVMVYALTIAVAGPGAVMNPSGGTLIRFGALFPPMVDAGEYWRLLSMGVLHIGLLHIGFNCMALSQVGPQLEAEIGSRRMLTLVTATQLASGLATHWAGHLSAGASGWLFGLIGFGAVFYHRCGAGARPMRAFFIQWAIYGLIFGFMIRANNTAHIAGLVSGGILGATIDLTRARIRLGGKLWDGLAWPSAILWLVTLLFLGRSILEG